jgi:diguanylate cyclase (GGDEF)-like protein
MNSRLLEQLLPFEKQKETILAGNLATGSLIVYFTYPVINHDIGLSWLATHILFNLIRYLFSLKNKAANIETDDQACKLYTAHLTSIILSGLLWGGASFLFFPVDSPTHGMYFILILAGVLSTSISLQSSLARAYPVFLSLVSLPLLLMLLLEPTASSINIAILFFIFNLFMLVTAHSFRKNLLKSIDLSIELKHQAQYDALTKISNKRYFLEHFDIEWHRAMRHKTPVTIIILDIDYFKKINDTYGHNKGDECLQIIAGILKNTVRRSGDFVSRIGGEEFSIVLANDKAKSAIKICEILRNKISNQEIPAPDNKLIKLSMSMGIACTIPSNGSSPDDFIHSADQALYEAKKSGRNCYRLANTTCQ